MSEKRKTTYCCSWEEKYNWIKPVKTDKYKAECVVCKKTVKIDLGGISQLNIHATTAKHMRLYSSFSKQQTFVTNKGSQVSLSNSKKIRLSEEDAAILAEIVVCLNIVLK